MCRVCVLIEARVPLERVSGDARPLGKAHAAPRRRSYFPVLWGAWERSKSSTDCSGLLLVLVCTVPFLASSKDSSVMRPPCVLAHQSVQETFLLPCGAGLPSVMSWRHIFWANKVAAAGCGLFTRRSLCVWLHFAGGALGWRRRKSP